MIDHITELQAKNGEFHTITVYYKSGRRILYEINDPLPNTVLDKYLNGTVTRNEYVNDVKVTVIH